MSLVLHRIPGIGSPRDFIRFLRCLFWRLPVRSSGFERAFAHGRARAAIERPIFFFTNLPQKKIHKTLWQTQIIRSPVHRSAFCMPFLHSNEARTLLWTS